jgi:hypothetical protein
MLLQDLMFGSFSALDNIGIRQSSGGEMEAVEALALVSGKVEKEILLRNEYLAADKCYCFQ